MTAPRSPTSKVLAPAALRNCPSCQEPQTKIRRVLGEGRFGASNYVCARTECVLGIDLSKLETWVAH